ncbi:hypothetical protein C440_15064 [Haloferax mucosum ATCC BAA-1512]|uniref:Helix-turn-helix domain-containing protein n=1 Tax=Haloferax mucosum ATCC BAA-1512 TaxID=662479 RepID=M0I4E0_9EURY|nr:helix-turn-helix domain-containing protein [Haloferax mucosum]ELZ91645.1 hypothetical protein C440_15064 [Haloferax mucosum ATCC BAA-1512]
MSCIADFIIRSPDLPLAAAMERAPAVRLEVEQTIATDPERPLLFVWACGGDFDNFESAMEDDETVGTPELLESFPDRRLYRVQVSEHAEAVIYPNDVEVGASRLDVTVTSDGVHTRMRFPDRNALIRYRELCGEMGLEMSVRRIYRGDSGDSTRYGLSDKQRRVLTLAAEQGYFDVPRDVALSDLAEELGISPQSTSERLRRGIDQLVSSTLASDCLSDG